MALSLLNRTDPPPTAIFASSDSKAVGVLDAAKKGWGSNSGTAVRDWV